VNDRLAHLKTHPTVRLARSREAASASGHRVFDFGIGDPSDPTPDFVRQALLGAVPTASGYPSVEGSLELRQAAARYLETRFGAILDPATQILATAGSKEAIFHLPMVLADPSSGRDRTVFGEPGYSAFRIGTTFAGLKDHPVPLSAKTQYLFGPEDVGGDVLDRTAIVFINYPHNPSGQGMPPALFEEWVAARAEHGFVLVSDEVYVDLYVGEAPHSLLEFGREGCLAAHSLSKRSGMTGYLSGIIAGDAEILAHFRSFRSGMGVATPVWTQAAAAAAWSDQAHVAERRGVIAAKRDALLEVLGSRGLNVYPSSGSLFLWVEVPEGETDVSYTEKLLDAGIVVAPGSMFGGQEGYFRVALSPDLESCRAVAKVWP
jgi:acetylornithine aminotransferase